MKQIGKLDRRLLCREGPKLEVSNSTRTDHCGIRTEMVSCSNFFVRSFANASAETAELATAAKPEESSANARNDCLMVNTNHQTGRSLQHMLCRDRFCRKQLLHQRSSWGRRGRNAMTGILTIVDCGCEKTHWLRLCQGWVSRNESSKLNRGGQQVRRDF